MFCKGAIAFVMMLAAATTVPAAKVEPDKQLLIVDRFEGEFAVLEYSGQMINLPRALLPSITREGDVLRFSFVVNREETEFRRQSIGILFDALLGE